MDAAELRKTVIDPKDNLSHWAVDYFLALPASDPRPLAPMLEAAMDRKYSGSPGEAFFTGGGLHTFGNFSKLDDKRILSVREALRASTNLVFVRLMRDVVRYYMFQLPGSSAALLADSDDPRRAEYLARFADREGREFMTRFYNKYKGKNAADAEKALLASFRPTPIRLAAVHRTIAPNATVEQFGAFINDHLESKNEVPDERIGRMYEQYSAGAMSLADRGYLATIHPLELWLVGYMRTHEGAKFAEIAEASTKQRQEVYAWLFNTHRKHAQDKRIAGLLEVEAFLKIHAQWKKMGFPFDSLTPSYATALGASADRPAALAEMMGIIVNGGVRKPVERIDSLHFAKGTPYETLVRHNKEQPGERILAPEVARTVADAIRGVVSDGTAKRVKTAFVMSDGQVIAVGGKTGTGDQRFEVYGAGGRLIESRFVNRSATFVFNIGERFFGSMTAYVHGPEAGNYDFTSALPVQLLATLAPALMPMIEPGAEAAEKRAARLAALKAAKPPEAPAPADKPADNAAEKPAVKASAEKAAAKVVGKQEAKPAPAKAKAAPPAKAAEAMPGAQNVKPSPVKPAAAPAR
jgi:membrane peptidoglycan carboxypeptidase